jgi:hypothetical protein
MALKTTTALETHPVGTAGLNGIINGNWERLEAIFLPLKDTTGDTVIQWSTGARVFSVRAAQAVLTYGATPAIPFTGAMALTLALTGDASFSTTGLAAGRRVRVIISADASARNLTFPGTWKWIGAAAPASIAASKTGILELDSTTADDSGVIARWTVQP